MVNGVSNYVTTRHPSRAAIGCGTSNEPPAGIKSGITSADRLESVLNSAPRQIGPSVAPDIWPVQDILPPAIDLDGHGAETGHGGEEDQALDHDVAPKMSGETCTANYQNFRRRMLRIAPALLIQVNGPPGQCLAAIVA
jgi:hypothetical protein